MLSRHLEDFYRIFSQMSLVFFEPACPTYLLRDIRRNSLKAS